MYRATNGYTASIKYFLRTRITTEKHHFNMISHPIRNILFGVLKTRQNKPNTFQKFAPVRDIVWKLCSGMFSNEQIEFFLRSNHIIWKFSISMISLNAKLLF